MSLSVANLAKALGVKSDVPRTDRYWREPAPLPWWTTVGPIVRLAVIMVIVGVVLSITRVLLL
jgi:hypothetical protein